VLKNGAKVYDDLGAVVKPRCLGARKDVSRAVCVVGACSLCCVAVPPSIAGGLQSEYVVKEGSTLRVLCEATGVPPPRIQWQRAGSHDNHTVDPPLSDLVRYVYLLTYCSTSLCLLDVMLYCPRS